MASLSQWIAEGFTSVDLVCGDPACRHTASLSLSLSDLPASLSSNAIGRRARCTACGARGATLTPRRPPSYADIKPRFSA